MKKYLLIAAAIVVFPAGAYSAAVGAMPKEDVAPAQEEYFKEHGRYLQVLEGNKLPHDEEGSVAKKFGKDLPPGAVVDVYQSPQGHGYQVRYVENGIIYSIGYGPEAKERTFSRSLLQPNATSTTPTLEVVTTASTTLPVAATTTQQ